MTTQTASVALSNNQMSKIFTGTATDGVWTNLQDSLSQTNLGILIPNAMINRAIGTYAEGVGAYRIINAQTLAVSRRGWLSEDGYSCYSSGAIAPHRVAPNEIVQAYTQPVDATAGQVNAIAWIHTTKGTELYQALAVEDAELTEMSTALQSQSIGDAAFNSNMTGISIQLENGGKLISLSLYDSAGGLIWNLPANYRMPTAGGTSLYYNFKAEGLSIPIGKGFTFKITTKSA